MITTLTITTDDEHQTELYIDGDQLRITLRSPNGLQVRTTHTEHEARTIADFIKHYEAQTLRRRMAQGEDEGTEGEGERAFTRMS